LHEGITDIIPNVISRAAEAYEGAAGLSATCTGSASHAKFLRKVATRRRLKAHQSRGRSPSRGLPLPSDSMFSRSYTTTRHSEALELVTPALTSSSLYAPYAMTSTQPHEVGASSQVHYPHLVSVHFQHHRECTKSTADCCRLIPTAMRGGPALLGPNYLRHW
jgi:hypothetical protein